MGKRKTLAKLEAAEKRLNKIVKRLGEKVNEFATDEICYEIVKSITNRDLRILTNHMQHNFHPKGLGFLIWAPFKEACETALLERAIGLGT